MRFRRNDLQRINKNYLILAAIVIIAIGAYFFLSPGQTTGAVVSENCDNHQYVDECSAWQENGEKISDFSSMSDAVINHMCDC